MQLGGFAELLFDDLVAEIDALVADVDTWSRDELFDLLLRLPTEGALQEVAPTVAALLGESYRAAAAGAAVPIAGALKETR